MGAQLVTDKGVTLELRKRIKRAPHWNPPMGRIFEGDGEQLSLSSKQYLAALAKKEFPGPKQVPASVLGLSSFPAKPNGLCLVLHVDALL